VARSGDTSTTQRWDLLPVVATLTTGSLGPTLCPSACPSVRPSVCLSPCVRLSVYRPPTAHRAACVRCLVTDVCQEMRSLSCAAASAARPTEKTRRHDLLFVSIVSLLPSPPANEPETHTGHHSYTSPNCGTVSQISSGTRQSALTLSDVY